MVCKKNYKTAVGQISGATDIQFPIQLCVSVCLFRACGFPFCVYIDIGATLVNLSSALAGTLLTNLVISKSAVGRFLTLLIQERSGKK